MYIFNIHFVNISCTFHIHFVKDVNMVLDFAIQFMYISYSLVYVINLSVKCGRLVVFSRFSPGPLDSSTNKTDSHDIAEILLKVALNTINLNQ